MDWSEIKPVAPRLGVADYPPNTVKSKNYLYYIKKLLHCFIINNENIRI
jgi:hypothetical protein